MGVRTGAHLMSRGAQARLRQALAAMMGLPDERGYQYFAGLHGLPLPAYCRHGGGSGDPLFLPWHRAYLYEFELALQDASDDPRVTVPWWNWSSRRAHREGLPPPHQEPTTADGEPNVLYDSAVRLSAQDTASVRQGPGRLTDDDPPRTRRDPEPPDELPRARTVRDILQAPTFLDFSARLENVHGAVHVWTGGSMTSIPVAAYDPVFWSHHAMVDRLWHIWQMRHPGAVPPEEVLDVALPPFALTVRQTLDISALGYAYAVKTR